MTYARNTGGVGHREARATKKMLSKSGGSAAEHAFRLRPALPLPGSERQERNFVVFA